MGLYKDGLIKIMKVTRSNIAEHLVEYQLSLIGKTVQDAVKTHEWKTQWNFTQEDYDKFKAYSIPLIKKTFKCNRKKAESTFDWFYLNFGLKIY